MTVEGYLKSLDPDYGSQEHQRQFLERMARADRLNPCRRDHSGDSLPTHSTQCYPTLDNGRMVGADS